MLISFLILIILPINSQEKIKSLPEKAPKNIKNLTKEEIYNFAYQYYKQCVKLDKQLTQLENEIDTEITLSKDKDRLIEEYENIINKYKKLQSKYGIGLSVYGGLTQELKAESFVSCDIYFHFFNGHISIIPGFYIKIYDILGGGLKFGIVVSF